MAQPIQGANRYLVHDLVGENERSRFYRATQEDQPDREFMLKIAKTPGENGALDREAYLLSLMADEAARRDARHPRRAEGETYGYQIGFPTVAESFIAEDQGARSVLVLGFEASDKLGELAPLSLIRELERVRVDPKTSAWILGKLLKIIAFAHDLGIEVKKLSASNVLVVRKDHLVTVLDWASATLHNGPVSKSAVREDIAMATKEVIALLNGNPETGELPASDQLVDESYSSILARLARGATSDARKAHTDFYRVVEANWKRGYHPWTTIPL